MRSRQSRGLEEGAICSQMALPRAVSDGRPEENCSCWKRTAIALSVPTVHLAIPALPLRRWRRHVLLRALSLGRLLLGNRCLDLHPLKVIHVHRRDSAFVKIRIGPKAVLSSGVLGTAEGRNVQRKAFCLHLLIVSFAAVSGQGDQKRGDAMDQLLSSQAQIRERLVGGEERFQAGNRRACLRLLLRGQCFRSA